MVRLLKSILQGLAWMTGLIAAIAIVIVIHKNAEHETAMAQTQTAAPAPVPPSSVVPRRDNDKVHYDPMEQVKLRIMEAVIQRTRSCLRLIQGGLLHQGLRNRKELLEKSAATCRNNAIAGLPADLQEINLAGLPLLAEQELEMILRYGPFPGELQTIRP